jgi:hypothetical protein
VVVGYLRVISGKVTGCKFLFSVDHSEVEWRMNVFKGAKIGGRGYC